MSLAEFGDDFDNNEDSGILPTDILAETDAITSEDIEKFKREKINPDEYEYFDGLEENKKRQIVVLSKLSPGEFQKLQQLREQGRRFVGIHELNNIMTLYEGMVFYGIIKKVDVS